MRTEEEMKKKIKRSMYCSNDKNRRSNITACERINYKEETRKTNAKTLYFLYELKRMETEKNWKCIARPFGISATVCNNTIPMLNTLRIERPKGTRCIES